MEIFERLATAQTPYVCFNGQSGRMIVEGRAIPNPDDNFWKPLLKWFYSYSFLPSKKTELVLNVEYFNSFSGKQIMFLLHKLDELYERGYDVVVKWKYTEGDEEMKEVGMDFANLVKTPFEFIHQQEEYVPVEVQR